MGTEIRDERGLELWGGLECTVNRIGDRFCDQFEKGGHLDRPEDLDLVAELGIRTLRYPVLWERTAPENPEIRDWGFADERLGRLRGLGISPIVGLVHHGSGPRYTSLVEESFAPGLAAHARAVAERYPWVDAYTPVNEPLTTARFSGLYGHWYPHGTDGPTYARALVNQIRATILSMAAIREINPAARLVQTDDLGKSHSTERLRYQAEFENMRRWATWDLLCGRVDQDHPLWRELTNDGIAKEELEWIVDHRCPPDVIGINHYLTSERYLDHRLERYPEHTHGQNSWDRYADVEAVRVLAGGIDGLAGLLREAWARYELPIAVTECHLGCTREEQARWLKGVWRQAGEARADGIDVRAVTVWSMFGAYDWCSLLTRSAGRYEPGVFDLRAPSPRPTALAEVVRAIATGEGTTHETFEDDGWWERPIRLLYEPVLASGRAVPPSPKSLSRERRPLLIVGARDDLGGELVRQCELRGLEYLLIAKDRDTSWATDVLVRYRPWGVVNATGYEDVDAAEGDIDACWRENASGPIDLAAACAERDLRLLTFSDAMVFDGEKAGPYVESDPVLPINVYGQARATAERAILRDCPDALVVRSGLTFGPDPEGLARLLRTRREDQDLVSPTYLPHLVEASLDLMLDGMRGIVHVANEGSVAWADFAREVAQIAGPRPDRIAGGATPDVRATKPRNSALRSERAWTMPTLEEAMERFRSEATREVQGVEAAPYLS